MSNDTQDTDARIATLLGWTDLGVGSWRVWRGTRPPNFDWAAYKGTCFGHCPIPAYSTDPAASHELVEAMVARGFDYSLEYYHYVENTQPWEATFISTAIREQAIGKTAFEAVALAALAALEAEAEASSGQGEEAAK
jgi:hypothetical protein